ncbi:hypothetical protein A2933_01915 [Candidatus Nomurabacteria bacterium RIFCSPLOWO2_01_FULL_46_18]|uniref:Type II secretion system protein GspG C-terminal domain-containing protein n=1 Tax=Candidatus Nomurabacteria bacterium RIFCSPLOWO2_01_FULL_46_18 TaxID=1801783 RepID=A0A1F6XBL6_9BACT|nr:MAG: hypothetical protein A2933_01915 [Candidatus Nomurabacteria bacterium RIFCSPLOWO2_01_FULL_46_18]
MRKDVKKRQQLKRGFTLIELLVVVAIIGMLSSIVLASLNGARAKARDAKKISEFRQLTISLALYFDKYGKYPNDGANVGTNPWTDNFDSMASQLKAEGFLSSIPISPIAPGSSGGASGSYLGYNYYNYGPTIPDIGGLLVTNLETVPLSTTGLSPSCRPFSVPNWCSTTSPTQFYCICNPY